MYIIYIIYIIKKVRLASKSGGKKTPPPYPAYVRPVENEEKKMQRWLKTVDYGLIYPLFCSFFLSHFTFFTERCVFAWRLMEHHLTTWQRPTNSQESSVRHQQE